MMLQSKRTIGNIGKNYTLAIGPVGVFFVTTIIAVTDLWPDILAGIRALVLVALNALRLLVPIPKMDCVICVGGMKKGSCILLLSMARLDTSGKAVTATLAMLINGSMLGLIVGGALAQIFGLQALGIAVVIVSTVVISRLTEPHTA